MNLALRVLLTAAALVVAAPGAARAEASAAPVPVVEAFAGERFDYDVSFLFFGRAAVGRISLAPETEPGPDGLGGPGSGRYVARLSAETKGFVGFFKKIRHVYTSTLVPCEGGTRWCSRVFVKDLEDRGGREVTTTFLNEARGVMTWTIRRDGVVTEIGREPIPEGVRYDDMLAALFNFRAGRYGPIEKGRRYELDMIPVEGIRTFTLRILGGEEEARARSEYGMGESGVVIALELPEAIFKNEGEIVVWFSPEMVPVTATVVNYLGLGDVTGRLVRAVRPAGRPLVPVAEFERERRERERDQALSEAIRRQQRR
ncbi:MAG TPA: DUF3108 domain-containing protein [Thermodesulfobacteriota bacterium]